MVAIDFRINAVLSATQSIPSREYQAAKLYSGDSEKKSAIFNWVSKVLKDGIAFACLCSIIWSRNLRQSFIVSLAELKTMYGDLVTLSFLSLTWVLLRAPICGLWYWHCDYFRIGFETFIRKARSTSINIKQSLVRSFGLTLACAYSSYAMYYENLLRHQHQLLYMKEQVGWMSTF